MTMNFTELQEILLVSIFLGKLFRFKKRVFRGVGQWSPAVYLNQLVVFIIGFDIRRVSTIKMHCKNWTAC